MTEIENLVNSAIDGNSESYTKLYNMSRRQVYFTCLGFVKNEADAADLMQEIFFTVMIKLVELKDKATFQAWVNRIAVNKCKDFLIKKKGLIYENDIEELETELPDTEIVLPDEYVENQSKRKIIMDIINTKLSDVQRQIIIMYYYNQMTIAEIAAEMECPSGTVAYRLNSARKIIKNEVLNYEKISNERLHSVSFIPALTLLLNIEAEKVCIPSSAMPSFTESVANVISNTSESTNTAISKIIAITSAIVVGSGATGYYISNNEYVDEPTYPYYELINDEYEKAGKNSFNNSVYWNGEELYYADGSFSYIRYNPDTNTAKEIIPEFQRLDIPNDGKDIEYAIYSDVSCAYFFDDYIYTVGHTYYKKDDTLEHIILKYNPEGEIEDVFFLPGMKYSLEESNYEYDILEINGITDNGKIYFTSYKEQYDPYNWSATGTYRINTDFTEYENNLDFSPYNNSLCNEITYHNGRLYAKCIEETDSQSDKVAVYAFEEDTLEYIEDDFFVCNDIDIVDSVGKYIITEDAIYDGNTLEIVAEVPSKLKKCQFEYAGGTSHYCCTYLPFKVFKTSLSDTADYTNISGRELIEENSDKAFEFKGTIKKFIVLDKDTFIVKEAELTYFCRISTGEKIQMDISKNNLF